jgi:hypothetical protein
LARTGKGGELHQQPEAGAATMTTNQADCVKSRIERIPARRMTR